MAHCLHADPFEQRDEFLMGYMHLRKWADLHRVASALIAEDENDASGWGFRGLARGLPEGVDAAAVKEAHADIDRAVSLTSGENGFWLMYRGIARDFLGRTEEADHDFERARELDPGLFQPVEPGDENAAADE